MRMQVVVWWMGWDVLGKDFVRCFGVVKKCEKYEFFTLTVSV